MTWKKRTFIVLIVIAVGFLGVVVYDIIAQVKGGSEATISSMIIKESYDFPFMVYSLGLINGILIGHLFWRMKGNKDTLEIDHLP